MALARASFRPAQVCLAPLAHQVRDRPQGPPVGRERVFHLGRHDRIDLAVDDAVVFQLAKLLGQHAFTDVRNFAPQFPEAAGAIPQPEQNEDLPFAPDHFQRGFHRTVVQGSRFRFFCSRAYHNVSIVPQYAYLFHALVTLTIPASNGDYRKAVKAPISGYLTRSTHDEN